MLAHQIPESLAKDFPLPTHFLLPPSQVRTGAVEQALDLLGEASPFYLEFTKLWTKNIFWVELKPEFLGRDSRITSSSFPKWPLLTFISNKALVHIPPNSVLGAPSLFALAENLFHEAIHQQVNAEIHTGQILTENFHSATSPKLHIHWRQHHELRNQYWEIDRAYHAACVYSGVIQLRLKFRTLITDPIEKNWLEQAIEDGLQSHNYLVTELLRPEFSKFLQEKGLNTIKSLQNGAYV